MSKAAYKQPPSPLPHPLVNVRPPRRLRSLARAKPRWRYHSSSTSLMLKLHTNHNLKRGHCFLYVHDTKKEETSAIADGLQNRTLANCRWDKSPYVWKFRIRIIRFTNDKFNTILHCTNFTEGKTTSYLVEVQCSTGEPRSRIETP